MSDFEAQRDFDETLAYEEWWDASRKTSKRPCPACSFPIEDPDAIACESCMTEWDNELQV